MEIHTWGRNASGSFAYLRKSRPLEYVDNRTFKVFCFSGGHHLTPFTQLSLRLNKDMPRNLWRKHHNSFFAQWCVRGAAFYRFHVVFQGVDRPGMPRLTSRPPRRRTRWGRSTRSAARSACRSWSTRRKELSSDLARKELCAHHKSIMIHLPEDSRLL